MKRLLTGDSTDQISKDIFSHPFNNIFSKKISFYLVINSISGIILSGSIAKLVRQGIANPQSAVRVRMDPPVYALVAQLDRVSDYESEGQEFESLRAHQILIES